MENKIIYESYYVDKHYYPSFTLAFEEKRDYYFGMGL
jgi:hypothetical protein